MPIKIKCRKCGFILYTYDMFSDPQGLAMPIQVVDSYILCPRCGRELDANVKPDDIVIKPLILEPGRYTIYVYTNQTGAGYAVVVTMQRRKYRRGKAVKVIVKEKTLFSEISNYIRDLVKKKGIDSLPKEIVF